MYDFFDCKLIHIFRKGRFQIFNLSSFYVELFLCMRSKQSNNGQDHRILFRVTEKKALFLFFLIVVVYWRILYMHCYSINLTVVYNNCGYRREAGQINNIKRIKIYQKAKDNFLNFFSIYLGERLLI